MKKFTTLLIAVLCSLNILADNYKILYSNTPKIKIGNRILKVGDTFDEKSKIEWENEKQAIKVQNLTNKRVKVLTKSVMQGNLSLADYYVKTNHLSTRGNDIFDHLDDLIEEDLVIVDSILAKSWLKTDEKNYFIFKFSIGERNYEYPFPGDEESILISSDLFDICPNADNVKNIIGALWFHFDNGDEMIVQEEWTIWRVAE